MGTNADSSDSSLWSGVKLGKKYDVATDEIYEKMVAALASEKGAKPDGIPPCEKSRIRAKFALVNQDGAQFVIGKDTRKPVLKQSQVVLVLRGHHDEKGHPGRITMLSTIKNAYHSIPQALVERYIKNCQKCASRAPLPKPPVGKAIRAKSIMVRVQADIIDMSSVPDGDVKYILQVKDHLSKFVWAFGLERKTSASVAACIKQIIVQFGPPRILQMDNGGEFTGAALTTMLQSFPCVKVVHGRPRHPQSQGLVERANQTLERTLGPWIQDNGATGWSNALPELTLAINSSFCRVIQTTPFELMFTRKVREPKAVEILSEGDDGYGDVEWVDEKVEEEHGGVHQEGVRQEVQPEVTLDVPNAGVPPADEGHSGVHEKRVRQEVQPEVTLDVPNAGVTPAEEGHSGVHQEGVRQEAQGDPWLAANGPCLIFEREPEVRAVAIGFIAEMPSVHNHEVLSSDWFPNC